MLYCYNYHLNLHFLLALSLILPFSSSVETVVEALKHASALNTTRVLDATDKKNTTRIEVTELNEKGSAIGDGHYSSVIAKSLPLNDRCYTYSENCRTCATIGNSQCRYCALKIIGETNLLVERKASGQERLAGRCMDITRTDWNDPILVQEEPERFARCSIIAPDYYNGISCFDIEYAGSYESYRSNIAYMNSGLFKYVTLLGENHSNFTATPTLETLLNYAEHRDPQTPFIDAILCFVLVAVAVLVVVSLCTIVIPCFSWFNLCCCLPCLCMVKSIRTLTKLIGGAVRKAGGFQIHRGPQESRCYSTNGINSSQNRHFKANNSKGLINNLSTTRNAWKHPARNHTTEPFLMTTIIPEPGSCRQQQFYSSNNYWHISRKPSVVHQNKTNGDFLSLRSVIDTELDLVEEKKNPSKQHYFSSTNRMLPKSPSAPNISEHRILIDALKTASQDENPKANHSSYES